MQRATQLIKVLKLRLGPAGGIHVTVNALHATGAIVTCNIEHDRIAGGIISGHFIQQPADFMVRMRQIGRKHLHLPCKYFALGLIKRAPGRYFRWPRRQYSICRYDPQRLLSREDFLPQRIPALIESPLVFLYPLLGHMVRGMHGTGGQIEEIRLLRRDGTMGVQPLDGIVNKVGGQVIVASLPMVRFHRRGVAIEAGRFPVVVTTVVHDAVEIIEPQPGRPTIKWTGG